MNPRDATINEVEAKAKQIMDSFYAALGVVQEDFSVAVERSKTMREPKDECDPSFKQKLLKNAPNKDMDFVLAEKKSW